MQINAQIETQPRLAYEATHIEQMGKIINSERPDRNKLRGGGNVSDNQVPRDADMGTSSKIMMSEWIGEIRQPWRGLAIYDRVSL